MIVRRHIGESQKKPKMEEKMEKRKKTIELVKASWEILRKNKKLFLLPALSLFVCLVIFSSIPPVPLPSVAAIQSGVLNSHIFIKFFLPFFFVSFVTIFLNATFIWCVINFLENGTVPGFREGFKIVSDRIAPLFICTLLGPVGAVIFGGILPHLRATKLVIILILLLVWFFTCIFIWCFTSFFVVPVLVYEKTRLARTIARAFYLLRKMLRPVVSLYAWYFLTLFLFPLIGQEIRAVTSVFFPDFKVDALLLQIVFEWCTVMYSLIFTSLAMTYTAVLYSYAITDMLPSEFPQDTAIS